MTFLNDSPVFGPVRSRRLGLSLGVNLMPPTGKICTFDCAYCENGLNAQRRTTDGYVTREEVTGRLGAVLAKMADAGERPDAITFAGNGEPTASPHFPDVVADALELRDRLVPGARICVLSNGTRAHEPRVHDALMRVDDNILKLDTVDQAFVELVDRPVDPGYDVARQVETFASFGGHCIIQTIFLTGELKGTSVDNTGERHVGPWLEALSRIRPSAATIYTIARDTPLPGLAKASPEALDGIAERVRALGIGCTVAY